MSQATQVREIDGLSVSITQMPPMKALRVANRVRRAIGPALGKLLGGSGTLGNMDVAALGDALEALNLPDDELEALVKDMLAQTFVDGKELMPQFALLMQGKLATVLKMVAFSFEVNFGSFFDAARAFVPVRGVVQGKV